MAPLSPATSFLFLKPQITSFALFNGVSAFCCALSHLKLLFASLSVSSTCFFSFLPKVSLCLSCRESRSVVAGWKLLIRLQSAQGCFFWPQEWTAGLGRVVVQRELGESDLLSCLTELEEWAAAEFPNAETVSSRNRAPRFKIKRKLCSKYVSKKNAQKLGKGFEPFLFEWFYGFSHKEFLKRYSLIMPEELYRVCTVQFLKY